MVLLGDHIILMPASSDESPLRSESAAETAMFVMRAATRVAFRPTALLVPMEIEGTIDASILPIEAHSYGVTGEPIMLASPYRARGVSNSQALLKTPARLRASDLINELQQISSQVNRMMAQVERAIDRLADHRG